MNLTWSVCCVPQEPPAVQRQPRKPSLLYTYRQERRRQTIVKSNQYILKPLNSTFQCFYFFRETSGAIAETQV